MRTLTTDLLGNVEEISRVEADFQRAREVAHLELLLRGTVFGARRRHAEATVLNSELDCPALLGRDRGHSVHRFGKRFAVDLEDLVVVRRDHPVIVGEGSVDQLGGQRRLPDDKPNLCLAEGDLHLCLALLGQLAQLEHGLARDDDARHPRSTLGQHQFHPGKSMPVGRDRADDRHPLIFCRVEIDAV